MPSFNAHAPLATGSAISGSKRPRIGGYQIAMATLSIIGQPDTLVLGWLATGRKSQSTISLIRQNMLISGSPINSLELAPLTVNLTSLMHVNSASSGGKLRLITSTMDFGAKIPNYGVYDYAGPINRHYAWTSG